VWPRRLLFAAVCLLGISGLVAGLLYGDANRGPNPPGYSAAAIQDDEFRRVVERLNAEFATHWSKLETEPAPPAPDLMVLRRLSLALTGTVPSLEEIRQFEEARPESPEQWWLSRLFADRRYSDYVAERLARAYVGTENGPFLLFRRRKFNWWLSDELHKNTPYDQIVQQLIAGSGLWTENASVNFITVTADQAKGNQPDPIRLAGRTTRAFLGVRLDCVQCHDDNLGGPWLQSDFHELAAYFAPASSSLMGIRDTDKEPYKYTYLDAEEEVEVPPLPPFNDKLIESPAPSDVALREQLAAWVTHKENRPFARAMVNRVWALMFGKPLVEPIDSIPLEGDYPPGFETLAADFVEHGYNIQRLIRVIAASDVFHRDSRAEFEVTIDHEDAWAVFPLTRLRPEQVAGGMLQSASLSTIDADSHIIKLITRFGQENEFVQRYGDMGEDEFHDRGGTIPQRLIMLNGELVEERTQPNPVTNASTRIARLAPSDEMAVEIAYLAILTRRPDADEAGHFTAQLNGARGDERERRLADIYWTLLNSSEFSWNH
jgi:hypothetical protein